MSDVEKLHVQIGQVKIGREGQSLHAILGSCVGIGFLYPEKGIFGLAHCLLSKSDKPAEDVGGGRHVDQALKSLQKLMDVSSAERRKVKVLLAGGANMTMPTDTDPKRLVGSLNASFACSAVREMGFRINHDDLGGINGRQVTIDCTSGEFSITAIPRLGD